MTQQTAPQAGGKSLYLALELGKRKWGLTFGVGTTERRRTEIEAGQWAAFEAEAVRAKRRFKLPADAPMVSCYEAGRDGFWLHRALSARGIRNLVVDSASIEVNRRQRRAKNDRVDGEALLRMLVRHEGGETKVFREVRAPSEEEEDARRLHREAERLKHERNGHRSRIESLLALHGISMKVDKDFAEMVDRVRTWDRKPLPPDARGELLREHERLVMAERQLREVKAEQARRLKEAAAATGPLSEAQHRHEQVLRLMELNGVSRSAWVLVMEFFAWRNFENERQVGALAGLTGTPYDSGGSKREQGISKAGNRRVRVLMTELAWCWLRYQPRSKLSQWYAERFGKGGKRTRRVGIVAVARQLLVALWRYLQFGVIPEGAVLKVA